MSRHHPKRFADAPIDPRQRLVVEKQIRRRDWLLKLDCGHETRRRFLGDPPAHVICPRCPATGGLGGNEFGKNRS